VTKFGGFAPGVRVWCEGLEADNSRAYFTATRDYFELGATLRFDRGISRDDGLQFVTKTWRGAAPVTGWLDAHVGASTLAAAAAPRRR
jgi:hypothetical protein